MQFRLKGEPCLSKALAYAATSKTSSMGPITISRRELRSNDVNIEILYCGVCHTDIHTAHGEWDGLIYPNGTIYPCVPGHEIVGRVTSVGPNAKRFKVGEVVALGTMVDSCLECDNCKAGLEPYCEKYATWILLAPEGMIWRRSLHLPQTWLGLHTSQLGPSREEGPQRRPTLDPGQYSCPAPREWQTARSA
jgi:threonine dehydrogenase-like Zn-dependent dehydrogenase